VPSERLRLDNTRREREHLAVRMREVGHTAHVSALVGVEPATHEV